MPTDLLFSLISVFFYLYYSWGFPFLLGIEVKRYKAMQLNEQSSFSNNLSSWVPDLTIIRTHFFFLRNMPKCYVKGFSIASILHVTIRDCHYISFSLVSNKPSGFLKVHSSFGKGDSSHWDWKKIEIKSNF